MNTITLLGKHVNKKTFFIILGIVTLIQAVFLSFAISKMVKGFSTFSNITDQIGPLTEKLPYKAEFDNMRAEYNAKLAEDEIKVANMQNSIAEASAKHEAARVEKQAAYAERIALMQEQIRDNEIEYENFLAEINAMHDESISKIEETRNEMSATKHPSDEFLARKASVEAQKAINESIVASLQP